MSKYLQRRRRNTKFENHWSIIFQTDNGWSLFYLILAKLLLLDISCENIFALSVVTALTGCSVSIKKCAMLSVFYVKTVKNCWRLGLPSLPNPGCATDRTPTKLKPHSTPPLKSATVMPSTVLPYLRYHHLSIAELAY